MQGYACEWPDCDKTYKKAADLERHERTHTGELECGCRVCGKRYARSDVISRHLVQTHGEQTPAIGRPRKSAWGPADGLEMCQPSYSVEPLTEATTTMRLAEKHPNFGVPLTSLENAPTQPLAGPPTDPLPNNEPFMLASMEPLDDDPLAFLSLDIRMPGVYDWGFGDQDFNMFKRSTPLAATTWTGGPGRREEGATGPGNGGSGTDSLHGQPQEIPDGQPDASPWPHIYKPKDRDAGVSVASLTTPFAAAALVQRADDHIPETARGTMRALVEHSYCGIWPSVEMGNFASVQALMTSANLYHRHFHNLPLSY
ncbi:hypothetical protein EHS25_001811 [Saitozyma podzolica]|uniref:C2H2-type domain-containing protein n=1 Tax=Saitozyma podzolica TaxID=1890683 RepID=A0A427YF65_9TREE|nr:hypothetical protein EHS25_001811 [Saitozyma podzolica]